MLLRGYHYGFGLMRGIPWAIDTRPSEVCSRHSGRKGSQTRIH